MKITEINAKNIEDDVKWGLTPGWDMGSLMDLRYLIVSCDYRLPRRGDCGNNPYYVRGDGGGAKIKSPAVPKNVNKALGGQ